MDPVQNTYRSYKDYDVKLKKDKLKIIDTTDKKKPESFKIKSVKTADIPSILDGRHVYVMVGHNADQSKFNYIKTTKHTFNLVLGPHGYKTLKPVQNTPAAMPVAKTRPAPYMKEQIIEIELDELKNAGFLSGKSINISFHGYIVNASSSMARISNSADGIYFEILNEPGKIPDVKVINLDASDEKQMKKGDKFFFKSGIGYEIQFNGSTLCKFTG